MKKIIILGLLIFPFCLFSQSYNHLIDDILNEISLDSLIKHVRILSGEDSVVIDGSNYLIQTRINNLTHHEMTGHYKAMQYLVNELRKYTPNVIIQEFPVRDDTVRNIISWINGADTTRKIILSGHYDSIINGPTDPQFAPGANDNGSGVAAVLEALRIFSRQNLQNSVYFILWDMEEDGGVGSEYYAEKVKESTDYMAMNNMDMIAWDTLSTDTICVFHKNDENPLKELLINLNEIYNCELYFKMFPKNPPSDGLLFMYYDICPTITIAENALYCEYPYPYYHTPRDKIIHFNFDYYLRVVKLGLALTAELALNGYPTNIIPEAYATIDTFRLQPNYPNPFNPTTNIIYSIPYHSEVDIKIYDIRGREIAVLVKKKQEPKNYKVSWDGRDKNGVSVSSGLYFYRIIAKSKNKTFIKSKKMMFLE